MNDKMVLGQYYNANSIIHRLDPRIKFVSLILLMVTTFLIPFDSSNPIIGFSMLGALFLLILIIILLTNVPLLKYLGSLKQIAFLLIFSFAFQLFANSDGNVVFPINFSFSIINIGIVVILLVLFFIFRKHLPSALFIFLLLVVLSIYILTNPLGIDAFFNATVNIYEGGIYMGTFIVARVFVIILVSTTLTLTTKPMDLANAIEWFLKPLELIKLKPSILAMMISIALRFIPTLFNETDKILKAQASRGVDFKEGKLFEQIKQIISLLVPMFVISFKRAVDLADAMESRGYIPGARRTRLTQLMFKFRDLVAFIIVLGLMASVIVLKVIYAL